MVTSSPLKLASTSAGDTLTYHFPPYSQHKHRHSPIHSRKKDETNADHDVHHARHPPRLLHQKTLHHRHHRPSEMVHGPRATTTPQGRARNLRASTTAINRSFQSAEARSSRRRIPQHQHQDRTARGRCSRREYLLHHNNEVFRGRKDVGAITSTSTSFCER